MTQYNYAQLESLWLEAAKGTKYATQAWAELMAAIAMAESRGDSNAHNPSGASGLWQILGAPTGWTGSTNWFDPLNNAKAAVAKLETQGLGAWQTYTQGTYTQFLQKGVKPSSLPSTSDSTNQPTQTQTTAEVWNPIQQTINEINPVLGFLIGGFHGTPASIGDLAGGIGGLVTNVADFLKLISWLFVPAHWLRIAAFFAGVLFLGGSLYMFKEAL